MRNWPIYGVEVADPIDSLEVPADNSTEAMNRKEPRSIWPATHGAVFAGALALTSVGLPPMAWPWFLLLPLLVYGGIVAIVPPLRRSFPGFKIGYINVSRAAAALA